MKDHTPVKFSALLDAFDWVSESSPGDNSAHICRASGKIYWTSTLIDLDEQTPEDIEDTSLYLEVPHKYDFDLGKHLIFRFVEDHFPDAYQTIEGFFRHRGAYRKFKDFLDQKDALGAWHQYEEEAAEKALREWSEDNELTLEE